MYSHVQHENEKIKLPVTFDELASRQLKNNKLPNDGTSISTKGRK